MPRFRQIFGQCQRLALAALVAAYPLGAAHGQTPKIEAAAEPAPNVKRMSEGEVPATLPAPSPAVLNDKTLLNYSERTLEEQNIASIKAEMEAARDELVKTKQMIAEVMKEQKQLAKGRELPPLEGGVINSFPLKNLPASDVVETIDSLFGSQGLRVAVDKQTNSLIAYGTPVLVNSVDALLAKIEERADPAKPSFSAINSAAPMNRTLMLRVFWLADGIEGLDDPEQYLPRAVIDSLAKLGLENPRLVAQTVTSISVEDGAGSVPYSTQVPAVLFDQARQMRLSGNISATTDNIALVDMNLAIAQGIAGFQGVLLCEMNGSLAAPIGHFTVLGTANSVISDGFVGGMGMGPGGGMGMGMEMGGGGRSTGRGMEMGGRGRGMMGAGGMGTEQRDTSGNGLSGGALFKAQAAPVEASAKATYNSSRFAFVVQVVEAESFAPEE